ncbi:MAG: dTDP-4-dehydrorhamnose reductase [Thermodesulfobacteriota bacterium]
MTILITGAHGQLGWELVRQHRPGAFDMAAFSHSELDITDPAQVTEAFDRHRPFLAINAAAYTLVDKAETETEAAYAVNRDGPAHLAAACARLNIPLIHISTDFVFDGQKGAPYLETDPISPVSVYGQSKAAGEAELRSRLQEHFIVRTAWVYGVHGNNFVKTMIRLARERDEVRVVADQYGSPTSAADLASAVWTMTDAILQDRETAWGTYHFCGSGITTWYGLASSVIERAGRHTFLKTDRVTPITTAEYPTPARRPPYSVLDCGRIEEKFGIQPPFWEESVQIAVDRMFSEGELSAE